MQLHMIIINYSGSPALDDGRTTSDVCIPLGEVETNKTFSIRIEALGMPTRIETSMCGRVNYDLYKTVRWASTPYA